MDVLKSLLVGVLLISTVNSQAKIALDIKWKEKDSQILQASVCYNYAHSYRRYRFCRIEARSLFKKRCENYRKRFNIIPKYKNPNKPRKKSKPHAQNKFCLASRTFMIL